MLKHLQIRNFALIDNSEVDFSDKLNIITGETGAGKSILIGALSILLGGRASVDQIRIGCDEAILNGVIDIDGDEIIKQMMSDLGIEIENDELIIRRVLSTNGKSRSFINGIQVTSKELSEISSQLFDFHGQHDGVALLRKQTHIHFLDSYANLQSDLAELKSLYRMLQEKKRDLQKLQCDDQDKEKKIELLQFEIAEIESANIQDNEDEILDNDIKLNENIEKLMKGMSDLTEIFSGDGGIMTSLKQARNIFESLSTMDSKLSEKSAEFDELYYSLEDLSGEFHRLSGEYQYEPGLLDRLIERSEVIEKLKRKHGGSIESVRQYCLDSKKELNMIIFSDEEKVKLQKEFEQIKAKYICVANNISKKRCESAKLLQDAVTVQLRNLGMEKAIFKIHNEFDIVNDDNSDFILIGQTKVKYGEDGFDNIEFMISPNEGEPIKSLAKIASGGELSRVILSLKTVLCNNDSVQTMIFDEIDTGIGGKVGLSIANALKKIAQNKQILCITHLAQIAAAGTDNYFIQKQSNEHRTVSNIRHLSEKEKISEIARMLSGNITELSINHAKELIDSIE